VICSPAAAASPWVAREIEAYRAIHPARPVLAAIAKGEPAEAFPAALCRGHGTNGLDPIAADFRGGHDGWRLGVLKLVAGLTGLRLDDIVQRDAQRRIRRVTVITVMSAAATIAMAVLTLAAVQARREAQRQRAEAEGLVEFMLTDLRDRLTSVGRLDVLTTVNERSLRYYSAQTDVTALPDESLARRARIFQAMGDDNLDRENPDAALVAYDEAVRTTAEQLARSPDNPERLIAHARTLGGIGRVYELRKEWDRARRYFSEQSLIAKRLLEVASSNADHFGRAASAAIHHGNLHLRSTKDYAAAERSYKEAIVLLDRAQRLKPGDQHALLSKANTLGSLADSFYYRSQWRSSLNARAQQYRIVDTLHAADPQNQDVRFFLAAARRGYGHSLLKVGEQHDGLIHLRAAFQMAKALVRLDPANAEWRSLHAKLEHDLQKSALDKFPRAPQGGQACGSRDLSSGILVASNKKRAVA
jgi:hypothetical protein